MKKKGGKKVSPVEYPKKQQENLRGACFLFFFSLLSFKIPTEAHIAELKKKKNEA